MDFFTIEVTNRDLEGLDNDLKLPWPEGMSWSVTGCDWAIYTNFKKFMQH